MAPRGENEAWEQDGDTELIDPVLVRARARVGSVLHGKWRLDVLLGMGGMAAVYAATHRNGSRGAVKLLHPEHSTNPLVRQRFLREGYVANSIEHPGVVRVVDDDEAEDGALFLVAELLDGETLEERRLRFGGCLGEDEVLSLADQLLDVLVVAHARGVVHRDLKPENVFLTRDGRVKVLDFGIARLRELPSTSNATKTGSSMGTPAYMANEQARGLWDQVDAQTDLWAVAATMFTLLTGRCVHEGRTTQEVLLSAMTKDAPQLQSLMPGVSPAVAHVVDRGLAQPKENRWRDAARMQERVRGAYHDRFNVPITTAPKLTVPETVPNRTIPSSSPHIPVGIGAPTTGQPVARSGVLAGQTRAVSIAVVALGGTMLVVVGVVVIALVVSKIRHRSERINANADHDQSPPIVTTTPSVRRVEPTPSSTTSSVAATDLPTVSPVIKPKPTPTAVPSPTTASKPSGDVPNANCTPPYVIDRVTGKKIFKVECL